MQMHVKRTTGDLSTKEIYIQKKNTDLFSGQSTVAIEVIHECERRLFIGLLIIFDFDSDEHPDLLHSLAHLLHFDFDLVCP